MVTPYTLHYITIENMSVDLHNSFSELKQPLICSDLLIFICINECMTYIGVLVGADGDLLVKVVSAVFLNVDHLILGIDSVPHLVECNSTCSPVGQDLPPDVLEQPLSSLPQSSRGVAVAWRFSDIFLFVEFK